VGDDASLNRVIQFDEKPFHKFNFVLLLELCVLASSASTVVFSCVGLLSYSSIQLDFNDNIGS